MDQQSDQSLHRRRRSYVIPKRSLVRRYPKFFVWTATITGTAIFFSRPLYDIFFRTEFTPLPEDPDERRAAILKAWKV